MLSIQHTPLFVPAGNLVRTPFLRIPFTQPLGPSTCHIQGPGPQAPSPNPLGLSHIWVTREGQKGGLQEAVSRKGAQRSHKAGFCSILSSLLTHPGKLLLSQEWIRGRRRFCEKLTQPHTLRPKEQSPLLLLYSSSASRMRCEPCSWNLGFINKGR